MPNIRATEQARELFLSGEAPSISEAIRMAKAEPYYTKRVAAREGWTTLRKLDGDVKFSENMFPKWKGIVYSASMDNLETLQGILTSATQNLKKVQNKHEPVDPRDIKTLTDTQELVVDILKKLGETNDADTAPEVKVIMSEEFDEYGA